MIKKVIVIAKNIRTELPGNYSNDDIAMTIGSSRNFVVEYHFFDEIARIRRHDFKWTNGSIIAGPFAPKLLQLSGGKFVVPNILSGHWVFDNAHRSRLAWHFNEPKATPLTVYNKLHEKKIVSANPLAKIDFPRLLITNEGIEFSRSPIPFSAIACFTDHCDFDTPENLGIQREFFKKHGVRVTKGFFLNDFAERHNSASWANSSDELLRWHNDGHELAYHSLSQSIKADDQSLADFESFKPPIEIATWIDHGYQPYNFSLYENSRIPCDDFSRTMQSKGIRNFWNYIDSATASKGVINQLNPADLTLSAFARSLKGTGIKTKLRLILRNAMLHHFADAKILYNYQHAAVNLKKFIFGRRFKNIVPAVTNFAALLKPISLLALNWRKLSDKPFPNAEFTPLVFKHKINGFDFNVCQTLEMVDFASSLSGSNLEKLVDESGVFIAHTYFSVPATYHSGRMFKSPEEIDSRVDENFAILGRMIHEKQIWNPTLDELAVFLNKFESVRILVDNNGNLEITSEVPMRKIN